MSRSSYLRGKFHQKLVKINENPIFIFHFAWNRKNIVSRRITDSGNFRKFQTISDFFFNKSSTNLLNKIPRSYINGVKMQSFSFVCLSSCSQSAGKVFPLESHSEVTRNFPGPKKIPRAYFDPLHLCTKFHPKMCLMCLKSAGKKNPKGIV